MARPAAAPPSMEVFESYFQRADLDRDGRISGAEAVGFFRGSNLPNQTLARIWTFADTNGSGFLGRPEFYNALRLVTVAQSGRELTPELVKAALYGPAAAKIPAPQINPVAGPTSQLNPAGPLAGAASTAPSLGSAGPRGPLSTNMSQQSTSQMNPAGPLAGAAASPALSLGSAGPRGPLSTNTSQQPTSQLNPAGPLAGAASPPPSLGSGGPQGPLSTNMSQQFFSPPSQYSGQSLAMPGGQASYPGFLGPGNLSGHGLPNSSLPGMSANLPLARPSVAPHGIPSQVSHGSSSAPSPVLAGQAGLSIAGSIPLGQLDQKTSSGLGSAMVSRSLPDASKSFQPVISNSNISTTSSFGGDVFSAASQQKQPPATPPSSSGSVPAAGSITNANASQFQPLVKQNQPDPFVGMASLPNISNQQLGVGKNSAQVGSGLPYTGFASSSASVGSSATPPTQLWPKMTPSNVQKYTNVFQTVDRDKDGKITGEEARGLFLSWKLPREVLKRVWDLSDQDNDSMLSFREFCIALYLMERSREGRPLPDLLPDSVKMDPLLPPINLTTNAYGGGAWRMAPGISAGRPPLPGIRPSAQPSGSRHLVGLTSQQSARGPALGVNNLHKDDHGLLNSKLQEANDAGNKIEAQKEILDSKEKIEYYRTKMQELVLYKSRCDNRLNEITERALSDRREVEALGKKYEEKYKQVAEAVSKLNVEEASFRDVQERKVELFNAIAKMDQGGTVDGLLQVRVDRIRSDVEDLVKALSERCKKHGLSMKPTVLMELPFGWQPGIQGEAADWDEDWDKFEDEGFAIVKELTVDAPTISAPKKPKSNLVWHDKVPLDVKSDSGSRLSSPKEAIRKEIAIEGEEKSTHGSPSHSIGRDFSNFDREDPRLFSPRSIYNHSDSGTIQAASSDTFAGNWPNFDASDDADSVWGFNSKELDGDGSKDDAFFTSDGLGLNPIRTRASPRANSTYQTKNSVFADSVPGTPLFNSNSPSRLSQMSEDHSFDSFSRFDSFNMNDNGLFTPRDTLARFDSMRSTRDMGNFARFDSMRSSRDLGDFKSFDDSDPFGSIGPFRSFEGETPKYSDPFGSSGTFKSLDETPKHSDPFGSSATFKSFDETPKHSDPFGSSGTFKSFDETPKHSDPFGTNTPFKSFDETPRRISDNWSAF